MNITNTSVYNTEIFIQSAWSKSIAGVFAFISILITCTQICMHLKNYSCSREQRWIIRILFIVPIYGLHSFLSLIFLKYDNYVYFASVRDVYEAFVIYSFLSLCYVYLDGESNILSELRGKAIPFSIKYGTCCFSGKSFTITFLRFCKQATLQFCLIKPVMSILTIVLQTQGLYAEGNLSLSMGYIYITIIYNISISIALYGLVLFYFACKRMLEPFEPVLKFITIKSVIFLSFWQGVSLAIIEKLGIFKPIQMNPGTISAGIQNLLICIELLLAAFGLWFAFPFSLYSQSRKLKTRNASIYLISSMDNQTPNNNSDKVNTMRSSVNSTVTNTDSINRSASTDYPALQTLSARLKETFSPVDIFNDTVINFHPDYKQYIQQNQHDQ